MTIENPTMAGYEFLADMYADDYFPDALVAKGEAILRELCERIEAERPADLPTLCVLSHEATGLPCSPSSARIKVVLPTPLSPIKPILSPRMTKLEKSLTKTLSPNRNDKF